MTYLIQINETQRLLIERALAAYDVDSVSYSDIETRCDMKDEVECLHDMTKDLPLQPQTYIDANGKECPMLNGFCL
jgi:hypothetical protein